MTIGNSFNTGITNYLNQNKNNTEETLSKIGAVRELSGRDSASLMIADSLNSQISSLTQEIQNSNDMVGMMQIADSAVSNMTENTQKLNDLSVRNNNAALNNDQKQMLNQEFQATREAIQNIADTTSYNGKSLLSSEFNLEVSGIDELSIENQDSIVAFQDTLASLSSQIGSTTNQIEVGIANSLSAVSNLTNASANISEEPMSTKVNDFASNQIKLDASIMAQNHQTQMLQQRMSALLV